MRTPGSIGPPGRHDGVRLINIYATSWYLPGGPPDGDLTAHLNLWRFEHYYQSSADQFPRVLACETLDPAELSFKRWKHERFLSSASIWLLAAPSGQLVCALSVDVTCGLIETIDLLEDFYFGDVCIGSVSMEADVNRMAAAHHALTPDPPGILPERHQLVCTASPEEARAEDVVQRVIYRANLPYRKEYSAISYPPELNRRTDWLAAVGPYVSVVGGHPDFMENSIFASAVQAVAASARLREIRQAAYRDVRIFRREGDARGNTNARRQLLEQIAGQLGEMELELSFSVEASADLSLLVPSLRAEGYHSALYERMGLADKARTTAEMLQRLARAISAELTAIESIERRADEGRRLRWAVAVGFVSVVAVPAGLIFAFFAVNATQINKRLSMFSGHYLPMYLAVFSLLGVGGLLLLALYLRFRREFLDVARTERISWVQAGTPERADVPSDGKISSSVPAREAGEPTPEPPRTDLCCDIAAAAAGTARHTGQPAEH
jgi:hypothetical protein